MTGDGQGTAGRDPVARRRSGAGHRGPDDVAVLVVDRQLPEDGAARVVVRLVDRWRIAGGRVVLYVLQRPRTRARGVALPAGVRPTYPAARDLRLRWAVTWGFVRMLGLARGADVVLAGREIGFGLVLSRIATRVVRRPFTVLVQSDPRAATEQYDKPWMRPLVRWSITTADRVLCVSPGLVPAAESFGVAPDRIAVAPNGVDVAAVVRASAEPVTDLPPGEGPLVVGVGRLTRQKGFDVLVRAHARVVAAGVPHRLVLLGTGEDHAALERLAADLGVSRSVHLPGFVANPLAVMAASDLYCLPSRWEGSPLTLAEAMVVGTPVVAADCVSGPRQLLADGRYGDLVPVDDVDALADAIERHLRAPERLRAAMAQGQVWARANLDDTRTAERAMAILREVVAAGQAHRSPTH